MTFCVDPAFISITVFVIVGLRNKIITIRLEFFVYIIHFCGIMNKTFHNPAQNYNYTFYHLIML